MVIDAPWYPEWANVGKTETLHFSDCWSSSGHPVTLHVTPREVPPTDTAAAAVAGMDLASPRPPPAITGTR